MATPASSGNPMGDDRAAPWLTIDDQPLYWSAGPGEPPCAEVQEEWVNGSYREFVIQPLPDAPARLSMQIDDGQGLRGLQALHGRWSWHPEGSAGRYALRVQDLASGEVRVGLVRVLPSNIGAEHYAVMLADIQRVAHQLIFHAAGGGRESVRITDEDAEASIGLIEFHKFEQLMTPLEQVLNSLRRNPRETLIRREARTPLALAAMGSSDLTTVRPDREDIVTATLQPSLDVYEHRLVRRLVVERLPAKARLLRQQLEQEIKHHEAERDQAIRRMNKSKEGKGRTDWEWTAERHTRQVTSLTERLGSLSRWDQRMRGWLQLPYVTAAGVLRQRSQPTPALMSEPRYSRFYKLYLAFNRDVRMIDLASVRAMMNVRQQWALYETWVALTLAARFRQSLLDGGYEQTREQGLFHVTNDTFVAELDRDCILTFERGDLRVRIAYERLYEPPTVAQRQNDRLTTTTNGQLKPDLAIELYERGEIKRMLIIDAKYRHTNGYALDGDVQKVREYLDKIAITNPDPRSRLPIRVACDVAKGIIAFPGEHPYSEVELASALPLVPGGAGGQLQAYEDVFEGWLA